MESNLLNYLGSLPNNQPGVALDIGANIGQYTGLLAIKFEHVYAFEPNPVNMVELQKNVPQPNVTFMPEAIGKLDNAMTELYICESPHLLQNPGMHTTNPTTAALYGVWGYRTDRFIMVPSVTLDGFAARTPNIRFIKCDIETGEDFIFEYGKELLKNNKITILIEVHMGAVNHHRLYKLFTDCGYTVYDDTKNPVNDFEKCFKNGVHFIIANESLNG